MSWKTDPYWPKTQAEFNAYRKAMDEADVMVAQSAKRTQKKDNPAKKNTSAGKKK